MLQQFTEEQINLLIRLILAHTAADFMFQTKKMVESKRLFSGYMMLHILIICVVTGFLSGQWLLAIGISIVHWLTDTLKVVLQKQTPQNGYVWFIADQVVHVLTIIFFWALYYNFFDKVIAMMQWPFLDYKASLILLGYVIVIYPIGYVLKYTLKKVETPTLSGETEEGGKLIGRFERVILLTLILLNQYIAFTLLFAAKGVLRLSEKDKSSSEFILVGTLMSYAVSMIVGVLINWFIAMH